MAVAGVVIIADQVFNRACVSMAMAPLIHQTPIVYCGPSAREALATVSGRRDVVAIVDLAEADPLALAEVVDSLSGAGISPVVLTAGDDAQLDALLRTRGAREVLARRTSGLDDVVQAVFDRARPSVDRAAVHVPLTHTQRRVMALFATGSSCQDIGVELGVSTETVKTHLKRVRAKYEAQGIHLPSRADVYRVAVLTGAVV